MEGSMDGESATFFASGLFIRHCDDFYGWDKAWFFLQNALVKPAFFAELWL
jgi:hypothetical protein